LLGASSDDDAEGLKRAFRRAVRANHPDLHPDDPGATVRLSGIVRAYAILRDAYERASYDHALGFERDALRPKPKRTVFNTMQHIFAEATAIAVLAGVLVGGYALLANVLGGFSEDRKTAEVAGPPKLAAVEPAAEGRAKSSEREAPHERLAGVAMPSFAIAPSAVAAAAKSGEASQVAEPAPRLPNREVAKVMEDSGAATDQLAAKINQFKTNRRADRPDQGQVPKPRSNVPPTTGVELSSLESGDNSKSPSPDISIPDQKHRMMLSGAKSLDAKPTELTPHERPRALARRQPANHVPVKQASLENKNAPPPCSEAQSCSAKASPLLGVGF
jgi:hypothetical protein